VACEFEYVRAESNLLLPPFLFICRLVVQICTNGRHILKTEGVVGNATEPPPSRQPSLAVLVSRRRRVTLFRAGPAQILAICDDIRAWPALARSLSTVGFTRAIRFRRSSEAKAPGSRGRRIHGWPTARGAASWRRLGLRYQTYDPSIVPKPTGIYSCLPRSSPACSSNLLPTLTTSVLRAAADLQASLLHPRKFLLLGKKCLTDSKDRQINQSAASGYILGANGLVIPRGFAPRRTRTVAPKPQTRSGQKVTVSSRGSSLYK
jgi:hypothetical protein